MTLPPHTVAALARGADAAAYVADEHTGALNKVYPPTAIVDAVCEFFGIQRYEVMLRSKHWRIVLARRLITVLCRRHTTLSYPDIAHLCGRVCHSTFVTSAKHAKPEAVPCANNNPEAAAWIAGRSYGLLLARIVANIERNQRESTGDKGGADSDVRPMRQVQTGGVQVCSRRRGRVPTRQRNEAAGALVRGLHRETFAAR